MRIVFLLSACSCFHCAMDFMTVASDACSSSCSDERGAWPGIIWVYRAACDTAFVNADAPGPSDRSKELLLVNSNMCLCTSCDKLPIWILGQDTHCRRGFGPCPEPCTRIGGAEQGQIFSDLTLSDLRRRGVPQNDCRGLGVLRTCGFEGAIIISWLPTFYREPEPGPDPQKMTSDTTSDLPTRRHCLPLRMIQG